MKPNPLTGMTFIRLSRYIRRLNAGGLYHRLRGGPSGLEHFDRHYSYQEAQERIPWVRSVFRRIHDVIRSIERRQGAQPAADESYGLDREADRQTYALLQKIPQLTSPQVAIESLTEVEKKELLNGLLHGLKNEGIIVQDVRRGLIDFPARKDGREIFLCYELVDGDHIGHWHELDAGFAGRQPVGEDDEI